MRVALADGSSGLLCVRLELAEAVPKNSCLPVSHKSPG